LIKYFIQLHVSTPCGHHKAALVCSLSQPDDDPMESKHVAE